MDGDLDQILLLVVGFFVSLGVLLFLLAWLEPNTEHHGSGAQRRVADMLTRLRSKSRP